MLWTMIIILMILWALGFGIWGTTIGPIVHLLLVIAVVMLIVDLAQSRRAI